MHNIAIIFYFIIGLFNTFHKNIYANLNPSQTQKCLFFTINTFITFPYSTTF